MLLVCVPTSQYLKRAFTLDLVKLLDLVSMGENGTEPHRTTERRFWRHERSQVYKTTAVQQDIVEEFLSQRKENTKDLKKHAITKQA